MVALVSQISAIRDGLLKVGFLEDRILRDVLVPDYSKKASLLGFADRPFDSRTSSVAVVADNIITDSNIASLRPLGTPIVFACLPDHFELWTQGSNAPKFQRRLTSKELPRFFEDQIAKLNPGSIYRAKLWGRLESQFQLDFVDVGLLPLIEEEAGRK